MTLQLHASEPQVVYDNEGHGATSPIAELSANDNCNATPITSCDTYSSDKVVTPNRTAACMETTSGSRSPSTATQSGGGSSDHSMSCSTERNLKYFMQLCS